MSVAPYGGDEPVLFASAMAGTDRLKLEVAGNDQQITVTALFDNLGKGASGAAVQNMNLVLGFEEAAGLN
ncbi:N-acetyl-gamma-glutamyl-phosphate reductase [bioreactor metagenome]|uniref:N-acetyl-gamma-glutamyl-phosphate reductase n=1 Tax=bioreactor metagenome TaxID=1076179 RepID=A0A645FQY2_9ZZZZ